MAQDHFKTPPGPKRGYIRPKKSQKSLKVRAKPAKARGKGPIVDDWPFQPMQTNMPVRNCKLLKNVGV